MLLNACAHVHVVSLILFVPNTSGLVLLSAHQGDNSFIPCFNGGAANILLWKINGSLYPSEGLPATFYLQKVSNQGLFVRTTRMNIAGEISCYTFIKGRPHLISSVRFVVQKRDENKQTGIANYIIAKFIYSV